MKELTVIIREELTRDLCSYYLGHLSDEYIVQKIDGYRKADYDVEGLFNTYLSWQEEKKHQE